MVRNTRRNFVRGRNELEQVRRGERPPVFFSRSQFLSKASRGARSSGPTGLAVIRVRFSPLQSISVMVVWLRAPSDFDCP